MVGAAAHQSPACHRCRSVPRTYDAANNTVLSSWPYALEPGLHEMLLQSEHRTLDPEVNESRAGTPGRAL